eukprot:9500251-Pyramimonas_sp.AAC.3
MRLSSENQAVTIRQPYGHRIERVRLSDKPHDMFMHPYNHQRNTMQPSHGNRTVIIGHPYDDNTKTIRLPCANHTTTIRQPCD